MKNISWSYGFLILIHCIIALAIFAVPFLSKIYALLIPIVGFYFVYRSKNKNNEVLLIAAYMVGCEVLLRMTNGNFNNEYVKFVVVFFMLLGLIYSNFSNNAFIYWFFLILLIPGIVITSISTDYYNVDVKKSLFFNLSGPVCLAICAIYTFQRKILFSDLQNVVIAMGLPIFSTTLYLFFYNPSVKEVLTGTQSNFDTSGGFGPNQVSTVLGLGIFIFFTQLILFSKSIKIIILNGILLLMVTYRAIVTFSRGGVIAAVIMMACLLCLMFYFSNAKGRSKFSSVFILTALMGIGIWTYTSLETGGLINKRYANQDAAGRLKKDRLGGREEIMDTELKLLWIILF